MTRDVLVVGAGMTGVTVAAARTAAGDRVTVLDKGRRHGGRMATRRVDGTAFDTGVRDFAASGAVFRTEVVRWHRSGTVVPAVDGVVPAGRDEDDGSSGRWRGRPTMRALPTALAETSGARVELATTVTALAVEDGRWHVHAEHEETSVVHVADALVLTVPAPQALALLGTTDGLASTTTCERLAAVRYDACLTVLTRPVGGFRDGGPDPDACTLRGDAARSAAWLDGDRSAAARVLADAAEAELGTPLEVVHVHGWRYAQVTAGIDAPALRDDTAGAPLVIAGDLCTTHAGVPDGTAIEGVERAFLSGRAAAALLVPGHDPAHDHEKGPGHGEGP